MGMTLEEKLAKKLAEREKKRNEASGNTEQNTAYEITVNETETLRASSKSGIC